MSKHSTIKIQNAGIPCERCGVISELRKHKEITAQLLKQPFYYSQWYQCKNPDCQRTTFMEEKYKVVNNNAAAREIRKWQERAEQTAFFNSL